MHAIALDIRHLTVALNNNIVLSNITTAIPQGSLVGIIGPNGAGKTTLLRSIIGLVTPIAGSINKHSSLTHSCAVAYVPQRSTVDWDFPATVYDTVLMGRYGHLGWFKRPQLIDHELCKQALAQVGMLDYAQRPIGYLSGGQQQRVFVARALAQQAQLYILDEPFIGIDAATEQSIITLFSQLRSQGKTIIVVHHDLTTAQKYFDWVMLINKSLIAAGPTASVITPAYINQTYNYSGLVL